MILDLFDHITQNNSNAAEKNYLQLAETIFTSQQSILFLNTQLSPDKKHKFLEELKIFLHSSSDISEPSLLIPTSGTTSLKLKIAVIKKSCFLNAAKRANTYLHSSASDSWLAALPFYHVSGLSILARVFLNKNKVYSLSKWNPGEFVNQLTQSKISFSSLVPTQIFDIVQNSFKAPATLKTVLVGGSALTDSQFKTMIELGWPLLKTFGMTETSAFFSTAHQDSLYKPLPGVEISIDARGYLAIQSDSLFDGYIKQMDTGWVFEPKVLSNTFWSTDDHAAIVSNNENQKIFKILGRDQNLIKIKSEFVNINLLTSKLTEISANSGLPPGAMAIRYFANSRNENELFAVISEKYDIPLQKKSVHRLNAEVLPFERINWYIKVPEIPKTDLGKVVTSVFSTDEFKEIYFENRKSILD